MSEARTNLHLFGSLVNSEDIVDAEIVEQLGGEEKLAPQIKGMTVNTGTDERDNIWPIDAKEFTMPITGTVYKVMNPTKWIVSNNEQAQPIFPEEQILKEIIHSSSGILTNMLNKMRWHPISKAELLRWIGKFGLERDLAVARDSMVDKAEEIVDAHLDNKDVETAKFVLKTAGKKRGWNERVEQEAGVGGNVYQFIQMTNGGNSANFNEMNEKDLVRYLEEQITSGK